MATTTKALPSGRPKRRAFFGAFDADGWWWASLKAFAWFILMVLFLGYIPDRAYYLTVNRTIDLGILLWSPINLCPAENGKLDCPPPPGSVLPWPPSPAQPPPPAAAAAPARAPPGPDRRDGPPAGHPSPLHRWLRRQGPNRDCLHLDDPGDRV